LKFGPTDKSYSASRPEGWDPTPASAAGYPGDGFVFTQGACKIIVTAENASGSATLPALTDASKKLVASKFPGYGDMQTTTVATRGGGSANVVEWTSGGDFFHEKMHGYRVAQLDSGKSILVVCCCPEQNWKTLKSTFVNVINSVSIP